MILIDEMDNVNRKKYKMVCTGCEEKRKSHYDDVHVGWFCDECREHNETMCACGNSLDIRESKYCSECL